MEMRSVEATTPLIRSQSQSGETVTEYVETDFGPVCVVRLGAAPFTGKPYIVTFHDIGLNYQTNFQAFFNFSDMKLMTQSFTVINVHAPGQEEYAKPLPDGYVYPSMDQLALIVDAVCKHYGAPTFIGIGVCVLLLLTSICHLLICCS